MRTTERADRLLRAEHAPRTGARVGGRSTVDELRARRFVLAAAREALCRQRASGRAAVEAAVAGAVWARQEAGSVCAESRILLDEVRAHRRANHRARR